MQARTWRLRVEGAVNRELELTYDQLRELATRDVTATLDTSAWYMMLLLAIVVGLAVWAFYTSVAGEIWKPEAFAGGKR